MSDKSKSFHGLRHENIRITELDAFRSLSSFSFRECKDCRISVEVPCASVFLHGLNFCSVTVSGVLGSIQVSDCSSSTIQGFCSQLRITDCKDIIVEVQTNSSTAIDNSAGIRISPPCIIAKDSHFAISANHLGWDVENLMKSTKWRDVRDFNCLSGDSTNWSFTSIN